MNIPNIITSLRLLLVPVLVYLLWQQRFDAAVGLFLVAGLSDALDGYIAKRYNLCTWLGSVLDPLADKALIISSVILLSWLGLLPWWLTMLVVGRDIVIVIGAGAFLVMTGELEMAPSYLSKLNTFVQIVLIFLTISQAARMVPAYDWHPFLYGLTALFALASGGDYVLAWSAKARHYKRNH